MIRLKKAITGIFATIKVPSAKLSKYTSYLTASGHTGTVKTL